MVLALDMKINIYLQAGEMVSNCIEIVYNLFVKCSKVLIMS